MIREAIALVVIGGGLIGISSLRGSRPKKKKAKKVDPEERIDAVLDEYSGRLKKKSRSHVEDFFEEYIEENGEGFNVDDATMEAAYDLVPMYNWERDLSDHAKIVRDEIYSVALEASE